MTVRRSRYTFSQRFYPFLCIFIRLYLSLIQPSSWSGRQTPENQKIPSKPGTIRKLPNFNILILLHTIILHRQSSILSQRILRLLPNQTKFRLTRMALTVEYKPSITHSCFGNPYHTRAISSSENPLASYFSNASFPESVLTCNKFRGLATGDTANTGRGETRVRSAISTLAALRRRGRRPPPLVNVIHKKDARRER